MKFLFNFEYLKNNNMKKKNQIKELNFFDIIKLNFKQNIIK